ncbi:MAG: CHASE2 domain-containing protein [Deltaproteobacteria bacterium]|nr:CHASE2 domain-containing protein [Deltaproteobacteria bacterium]
MHQNFLNNRSDPDSGPVKLTGTLFLLFCALPIATVLYIFYGEEVRSRLENDLFDIRTRIKPQTADTSGVAIVTISQKDIALLEGENVQVPGYKGLEKLISAVMKSSPLVVALVIPHHDLDYESDSFSDFIGILGLYPGLYFGSFDLNFNQPSDSMMPDSLLKWQGQEFGAGTLRQYRREVVRSLPLMSYRDEKLVLHLTNQMALDVLSGEKKRALIELNKTQLEIHQKERKNDGGWEVSPIPQVSLNYIAPEQYFFISAADLIQGTVEPDLRGRIVLIGYTAYRKRTYEYRDGTYVNTPWEWDGHSESFGAPLICVLANQIQNFLESSWLKPAPFWVNIFQTVAMSLISFLLWHLPPFFAVCLFCLLQLMMLWVHGFIFALFSYHIPLADTVLFSVLSTIIGAFIRAHQSSQILMKTEYRARSRKKLAMMQSRFLNRFATELFEYNKKIGQILNCGKFSGNLSGTARHIWQKACSSHEELRDYLSGIRQYSSLTSGEVRKVRKSSVKIFPLIRRILLQFESQTEAAGIRVLLEGYEGLTVWTDELILEPVLFNLISNAIRYSPEGGLVSIFPEQSGKDRIRIRVKDEGPGIPEEFHSKIFEKFYRVKNDNVYKVKGTGLGLYLCRYFADKISAEIDLISSPGSGSEFILSLEALHE